MSALGNVAKYELRRQLGRGAMGIVYEAFDTVIERRVALKVLRTDQFAPELLPDVRARFKREAHSAGRLSHPNIVTVFDYGEHDGMPYIVMDLMEGEELTKSLEAGARMGQPQVLRIMEQLLAALAYAHERGVIHRDIKPSNMFVLHDGTLKVVDFGLARVESSQLTETGALLGTPSYMSPEQFLGLPVDARSDVFSAGVILYQLLTGDRPFSGTPSTIMQKVLRQDPVEPSVLNPTLSDAWDALVRQALAKKPDERLASAKQFLESMRLVAEGRSLPGLKSISSAEATLVISPPAAAAAATTPAKSRAGLIAAGIAGGAAAAAVVGALLYRSPTPAPKIEEKKPALEAPVAANPVPAPKPRPVEKKVVKAQRVEKPVPKPAAAPPPAPVAQAKIAPAPAPVVAKVEPAPLRGKVVSLDRTWGFMVIEAPQAGAWKLGERLSAQLADGRRVTVVVRRISGTLVSAIPEGQKISDDMLGASVGPR